MDSECDSDVNGKPRKSFKSKLWPSVPRKKRVFKNRKNEAGDSSSEEEEAKYEVSDPLITTIAIKKECLIIAEPDAGPSSRSLTTSRDVARPHTDVVTIPRVVSSGNSNSRFLVVGHDDNAQPSTSAITSHQSDARNKRKGPLPEAKTIIKSVYNYLQTEYQNLKTYISGSCDLSPLENILERTSAATGLSEEEVTAILEEGDSDDSSDESPSKRARVSQDYYEENISSLEEYSSGESADEARSHNIESSIKIEENPIETLKVEIDENVEYHSKPNSGTLFQIPFSRGQKSVLDQSFSPSKPTHAKVKQEPIDVEDQQRLKHLELSDAVEDTGGEKDSFGEPTSAVHHLLQSNIEETSNTLMSIKVECLDTEYPSSPTT